MTSVQHRPTPTGWRKRSPAPEAKALKGADTHSRAQQPDSTKTRWSRGWGPLAWREPAAEERGGSGVVPVTECALVLGAAKLSKKEK